jgi:hypothetical protein
MNTDKKTNDLSYPCSSVSSVVLFFFPGRFGGSNFALYVTRISGQVFRIPRLDLLILFVDPIATAPIPH